MKLKDIKKAIREETISYDEIDYLQTHRKEVLATGDIELAQWAGITEDEWRSGKIN